jgi:DNA-binding response OmpR family regulator
VSLVFLLSDRRPDEVLPALGSISLEVKTEHLSAAAIGEVLSFSPEAILVDAAENPGQGHAVLRAIREAERSTPVVVILERRDLERFRWEDLADELLYPGAPEAEIQLRMAMLRRRAGRGEGSTVKLGALAMDLDSYAVTVGGRSLGLTYKEFELLRFLAERPGRVFTRPTLLREVWGFDFYGGTRTVDVHVRRLRAKLGPEHEGLVETVRGVGYRAAAT